MTSQHNSPFDQPSEWVEATLGRLSTRQKLGQLLHPIITMDSSPEAIRRQCAGLEPGGASLNSGTAAQCLECTTALQQLTQVPILIGTDFENGPGRIVQDATQFPDFLGLAATGDERLAYEMGRSGALEGRALGVHWSFSPVVDINAHPFNPITNTRGLGDDPELIMRLAVPNIRGMQENGMAACAKHFPGDGFDVRDQHICTSINPLRLDEWFRLSGRMFQTAIDAGVWTIMIGHIALPAWDPGDGLRPESAPPATLSRRLVTDLLRGRLGFRGLVVTDALNMGGVTTRADREDLILGAMEAGADLLLFAEMEPDFAILEAALDDGRLSLERVEQSVRRILRIKELLGLHQRREPLPLAPEIKQSFQQSASAVAENMLTLVSDPQSVLQQPLKAGDRVYCFHVRGDAGYNVDGLDDLLRRRGLEVTHGQEGMEWHEFPTEAELLQYDAVLVNLVFGPTWGTSRIRPNGNYQRDLWRLYGMRLPRVISISFGSPYLHFEYPHAPVWLNAYSPDPTTQAAVVRLLCGEIPARGHSPVRLDAPWLMNTAAAGLFASRHRSE